MFDFTGRRELGALTIVQTGWLDPGLIATIGADFPWGGGLHGRGLPTTCKSASAWKIFRMQKIAMRLTRRLRLATCGGLTPRVAAKVTQVNPVAAASAGKIARIGGVT
jgi:hypothetical protein